MTYEFIAFISVGFAVAGLFLLTNRMFRGRLPRWTMPAAIGAGMIAFSIYSEYSWFPRVQNGLPEGAVIARAVEHAAPWRPWTYAVPLVTEIFVVDRRAAAAHPQNPALIVVPVYRLARWQNPRDLLVAFDCAGARRVDIVEGVRFDDDGALQGGAWVALSADDAILVAACEGG